MADHRLKPRCATGGTAPRKAVHDRVTLAELPGIALASVAQRAGGAAALAECTQALTGAPLPEARRKTGARDALELIWTAPGQWFALAPLADHPDLAADLSARVKGAASVTDQSGGWVCITLSGAGCTALLERLCPRDLGQMQAGMADRTGIAHMNCLVICDTPGTAYRVLGARSSAYSLWDALETVARGLDGTTRQ